MFHRCVRAGLLDNALSPLVLLSRRRMTDNVRLPTGTLAVSLRRTPKNNSVAIGYPEMIHP